MAKILVVDDETDALELIEFNLLNAGYKVITASNGSEAVQKAKFHLPDLVLLDLMLPEIDGLEVCKLLRRDSATTAIPIIMLTAKAAEIDRVLGLELGADDYVTKPFSPRELLLRIKNLLKRRQEPDTQKEQLRFDGLLIDIPRHEVVVGDQKVDLTAIEFKLLVLLAQRVGRVQPRERLLKEVWGYDSLIDTRTVDTHVRRIRDKLGSAQHFVDTVRGVGYRFCDDPQS